MIDPIVGLAGGSPGPRIAKLIEQWAKLTPEEQTVERPHWISAATKAALADGHAYCVHKEQTVLVFTWVIKS